MFDHTWREGLLHQRPQPLVIGPIQVCHDALQRLKHAWHPGLLLLLLRGHGVAQILD
jgi:hypothetical protein